MFRILLFYSKQTTKPRKMNVKRTLSHWKPYRLFLNNPLFCYAFLMWNRNTLVAFQKTNVDAFFELPKKNAEHLAWKGKRFEKLPVCASRFVWFYKCTQMKRVTLCCLHFSQKYKYMLGLHLKLGSFVKAFHCLGIISCSM